MRWWNQFCIATLTFWFEFYEYCGCINVFFLTGYIKIFKKSTITSKKILIIKSHFVYLPDLCLLQIESYEWPYNLSVCFPVGRPKGQHSAPRGGPPRSWTNAELTEALQHVWNKKMTTSQASRIFGIPYNSLLMYVRGKYGEFLNLNSSTPAVKTR